MSKTKIIIDKRIRIESEGLPEGAISEFKKRLVLQNPRYLRNEQYGRTNFNVSKYIYCLWRDGVYLTMPRGFIRQLVSILHFNRVDFEIEDHTRRRPDTNLEFKGDLFFSQQKATEALLKKQFGILTGPVGCGKKVVSLYLMAERKQPALIICHTKQQLYAWNELIGRFLGLSSVAVGLLGDGHKNVGDRITVAIVNSLYSRVKEIQDRVGFLIVDRCDDIWFSAFYKAVAFFDSPFMLGLSTQSYRHDGLTRVMYAYLGDKVYEIKETPYQAVRKGPKVRFEVRNTGFTYEFRDDYNEMMTALVRDQARNELIATDILEQSTAKGSRSIVVSERKEHLEALKSLIEKKAGAGLVLTGATSSKDRKEILKQYGHGQVNILLATPSMVEGLGIAIDRFFVATPLKDQGHVMQYVGQLLGTSRNKRESVIYDYVDKPEILRVSFDRRRKVYKGMGVKT